MLRPPRRPLLVLLLLLSGCAVVSSLRTGFQAVGRWVEGFATGEGQVVDGEQQGEWTFTTEDGLLRARGGYKDDVQDGPWTYWYRNGNKEYEGTFRAERREGLWRYWHPNGNPRAQGHFVDGREFGEWIFWSTQGGVSQRGHYLDGLQAGTWTYWNADGTKQAEGLFHDGNRVAGWSFWDASGSTSQTWFEVPAGVEPVRETWPDGTTRREGFLVNGRQHGIWILRHQGGGVRMLGTFQDGTAHGQWVAFRAGGERLAAGRVELGRPQGDWAVSRDGGSTWSASGASPAPPFPGSWSEDSLADSADVGSVVGVWLAESMAPVSAEARLAVTPPAQPTAAPTAEQLVVVEEEPDVPVQAQPWTQRELEEYTSYVRAYEDGVTDQRLASRYGGGSAGQGGKASLAAGGDEERMREYLGKPLPLTIFKDSQGTDVDLSSMRGKKVILIVLRGFSGGICVYCTAQTEAFCKADAFDRFENLGAELIVVFPGARNGLDAFRESYEALTDDELPPYGVYYENDYIVSKVMDLEGDKVTPSTFILDEEGVVRFAYIGKHAADRPSVALILETLEGMGRVE